MFSIRFTGLAAAVALALALAASPVQAQQTAPPQAPGAPTGKTIPIPNATPSHLAAARELVAASGLAGTFMQVIPNLMGQIDMNVGGTRPELSQDLKTTLKELAPEFGKWPEEMLERAARIYTAVLTEQECKDALAFFQSPVGRKFIDVQPTVIGNLTPAIQQWTSEVSVRMMDRVREAMAKKGHQM